MGSSGEGDDHDEALADRLQMRFTIPAGRDAPAPRTQETTEPAFVLAEATSGNTPWTDWEPDSAPAEPEAPPSSPLETPTVDVERLVRYLDAQLKLTRQRSAQGFQLVLDAVGALDERVGKLEQTGPAVSQLAEDLVTFQEGLLSWLEHYSQWEFGQFQEIRDTLPPQAAGPEERQSVTAEPVPPTSRFDRHPLG